jgi:hypothetical protein
MHCFSGCSIEEITSAIGLTVSDLFPKTNDSSTATKGVKRPFSISQLLPAFERELLIATQYLGAIGRGESIPEAEKSRAKSCAERLAKLAGSLS